MSLTSPRATATGFPNAPVTWASGTLSDLFEWCRKIAEIVNSVRDGKINATGTVTLTANAATTTLTDTRITPNSKIMFMPTSSNGAAGVTALYVSARTTGSATLTHANNAQTDRTYGYAVLG